jgi:hypothetical protein
MRSRRCHLERLRSKSQAKREQVGVCISANGMSIVWMKVSERT